MRGSSKYFFHLMLVNKMNTFHRTTIMVGFSGLDLVDVCVVSIIMALKEIR